MIIEFISSFILPVALALLITPLIIKFANRIGAVDQPGERKIHKTNIPRIGGISVLLSSAITVITIYLAYPHLFAGIPGNTTQILLISGCIFLVFLLGIWDDLHPLNPGVKFGVQFLVAGLLYFAGFKISIITNPIGAGMLNVEMIDFPLTLLWIVGITNAFNLIDGLDGLASGVATIACISIFTVSALSGEIWMAVLALILAGSLVGFLRYNFNPARIFLGDSGSLTIGFCLALLSIQSTTKISTGFALLFPFLVLGLPIADTLISMLRRFLGSYLQDKQFDNSKSILHKLHGMFVPDSSHIHHQLISLGLTHRNTVLVLYFVSAFFGMGALIITQTENLEKSVAITLVLTFVLFLGIKKLRYREISILNNGLMMPIYERWVLNRTTFINLFDICFIAISFSLSYFLTRSIIPDSVELFYFNYTIIAVVSVQLIIFWLSGLYRETIQQMGIGDALSITASVGYAAIGAAIVMTAINDLSLLFGVQILILDFYFLLTFTLGFRTAYQALEYWFHREKNTGKNVLIYGANTNGTLILNKMNSSTNSRFKVLGFLDDNPDLEGKLIYGYPILGGHWKLAKITLNTKVDYILVSENNIKPENFKRVKALAKSKGIEIKQLQVRLQNLSDSPAYTNGNSKSQQNPVTSLG